MNVALTNIMVPAKAAVPEQSRSIFEKLERAIGRVPNMYAVIGYSPNALKALLSFEEMLSHGAFNPAEREAVFLAVSEVNQCQYCLAAHSQVAISKGLSTDQVMEMRHGRSADQKLAAALTLARAITQNQGKADPQLIQDFFSAGYSEAALMELIGLITSKIFTNYVFAVTPFPIDFPTAEPLT